MWKDYWVPNGRHHRPAEEDVILSSSNFVPLWARVLHNRTLKHKAKGCGQQALDALKNSGLIEVRAHVSHSRPRCSILRATVLVVVVIERRLCVGLGAC
jgi:hypothetical protein